MISRRAALSLAICAPAIIASHRASAGGAITLIVPGAPGSSADQAARAFAPFLERHLPRTSIWMANHAGDGSLRGLQSIIQSPPDGHTIGWISTPSFPARSVDHAGASRIVTDLRLIGAVAMEPMVVVQSGDGEEISLASLVADGKRGSVSISFATPPAGTPAHLAALMLQRISGHPLDIIPFPSAAAARQAAQSHNVSVALLGLMDAIEAVRAGRLRGIAVASAKPLEALPETPLLRDLGIDMVAEIRRGISAPAALPDAIADKFAECLAAISQDPEFQSEGSANGFTPDWITGSDWTVEVTAERAKLASMWQQDPWLPSNSG